MGDPNEKHETVVYEVHVKGFSKLCPHIPQEIRGTYAALGSSWAIEYFKDLGITAVELLPVQQFVDDKILADRGLHNYWGYNSIGYFVTSLQTLDTAPADSPEVRCRNSKRW
jgi:isoamylase